MAIYQLNGYRKFSSFLISFLLSSFLVWFSVRYPTLSLNLLNCLSLPGAKIVGIYIPGTGNVHEANIWGSFDVTVTPSSHLLSTLWLFTYFVCFKHKFIPGFLTICHSCWFPFGGKVGGIKEDNGGGDQQKFHMHELVKYMNLKHVLDSGYIISFFLGNTDYIFHFAYTRPSNHVSGDSNHPVLQCICDQGIWVCDGGNAVLIFYKKEIILRIKNNKGKENWSALFVAHVNFQHISLVLKFFKKNIPNIYLFSFICFSSSTPLSDTNLN